MPKIKLTKRAIESATADERDVVLWDTELAGFCCKITPKGKRVYQVYYRTRSGQQRRPTIGAHGVLTCDEARNIAKTWLADAATGGDPSQDKRADRSAVTLREFADQYLTRHAKVRKKPLSVEADVRNLKNHILPALGSKAMPVISKQDIARFHSTMSDKPGAANRSLALLSKMFNLAELWGVRPDYSNPCRHIEKYKERKIERFLSGEEFARLGTVLAECESDGTETGNIIAAIRLLIFTGCRRDEILKLEWSSIDFEHTCIRLPDSKTGAKPVYLNAPALKVLSGIPRKENNPYVIVGAKRGAHLVNIEKPWRRIRERAKLPDVRLHDLRHSFASIGASTGMGLPMIGALLGHKDTATTQRYAHVSVDPLRAANEVIGAEIAEALGTKN